MKPRTVRKSQNDMPTKIIPFFFLTKKKMSVISIHIKQLVTKRRNGYNFN